MVKVSTKGKESLDLLLKQANEEIGIPGVVFAVTDATGIIYDGSAGLRIHNDPSSGRITTDDILWICSQTKLIASIAATQLLEQGKISLDMPVTDIIPELSNPVVVDHPLEEVSTFKPAKKIIKMSHLFNHSSGLAYVPRRVTQPFGLPYPYIAEQRKENSISYFYRLLKGDYPGVPLHFEPGSNFVYGYNFDTLGFIVERITGKSLHDYCTENIFNPIGMEATFHLTPEVKAKSVEMSFRDPLTRKFQTWANQTPFIMQDLDKVHLHLGGIGVYTSTNNYLVLLRNLLQTYAGVAKTQILSQETVRSLFNATTLTAEGVRSLNTYVYQNDSQWSTGLCVNTTDWPGMRRKGSGWWFGWAGTYYFLDPTTGIAAMLGTQFVPVSDPDLISLWAKLETALYAGLEEQ